MMFSTVGGKINKRSILFAVNKGESLVHEYS